MYARGSLPGGGFEVLSGGTYDTAGNDAVISLSALQELEEPLGVLLLLVGRFVEHIEDLHETLLLGLGGEVGVAIPCLGLAGKGGEEVLFGSASLKIHRSLLFFRCLNTCGIYL